MQWIQVTLNVSKPNLGTAENALEALGALAVTIENGGDKAVFELPDQPKPLWQHNQLTGLFSEDTDPVMLSEAITQQLKLTPNQVKIELLADQPWERAWMDRYHPIEITKDIWIVPSWLEAPYPEALNIVLDPGLAFGTGTHPTTKLCLEWLAENPPLGQTVIDYGCGSGILSIAAMKLEANLAYAVDIEEEAVKTSAENAKANAVDLKHYHCFLPDAVPQGLQADVVMANILAGPLESLAPTLLGLLKPQGTIVLSGILNEQAEDIIAAYSAGCEHFEIAYEGEWCRINATKV